VELPTTPSMKDTEPRKDTNNICSPPFPLLEASGLFLDFFLGLWFCSDDNVSGRFLTFCVFDLGFCFVSMGSPSLGHENTLHFVKVVFSQRSSTKSQVGNEGNKGTQTTQKNNWGKEQEGKKEERQNNMLKRKKNPAPCCSRCAVIEEIFFLVAFCSGCSRFLLFVGLLGFLCVFSR